MRGRAPFLISVSLGAGNVGLLNDQAPNKRSVKTIFPKNVVLVSEPDRFAPKATLRSLAFNPKVGLTLPLETTHDQHLILRF